MAQGVCVITEFRGGAFRRVSFEVASEGRRLAAALGEPLTAIALGDGVAAAAADLGHYGVEKVYAVDQALLKDYLAETYAPVAAEIRSTSSGGGASELSPGERPTSAATLATKRSSRLVNSATRLLLAA